LKAREDIAWLNDSVRPYESIWSVLQRFFAMNVISSTAFAKEFFTTGWFSEISTNLGKPVAFDFEKFYRTLGLNQSIYKKMDLQFLRPALIDIEERHLKYCPVCIEYYYHSIFFQLKNLETCPVHKVALIDRCSFCNSRIDSNIQASNVSHPYSCRACKAKFLNDSPFALLHLPKLEGLELFDEISDWCDYAITVPKSCSLIKINSRVPTTPSKWFYSIYQTFSDRKIPEALNQHKGILLSAKTEYSCGIKTVRLDNSHFLEGYLAGQVSLPNLASIFKSYRRYLLRKKVGNWAKGLKGEKKREKLLSMEAPNLNLFAIERLTGRVMDLSQSVVPQNAKRYIYITINFSSVYDALKACKNSQEAKWVIYHAYFSELECMYEEALARSAEMIINGDWRNYHSLSAINLPCSCITRGQDGVLIYTSIKTKLNEEVNV